MGSSSGFGATVFLLVLCLWGLLTSPSYAARLSASRQKLEVTKHLNRLNKPAVKSIQVRFFLQRFLFSKILFFFFWVFLHPPHFSIFSLIVFFFFLAPKKMVWLWEKKITFILALPFPCCELIFFFSLFYKNVDLLC